MKKLLSIAAILMLAAGGVLAGTISVDFNEPACVSGVGQPDPYSVIYCNIQDAIDDATAGDVINVAIGTYIEQVTISKSLSLIGAGELTTTILAPTSGRVTITENAVPWDYVVAADGGGISIDVKIEGFTIDANGQNATAAQNFAGVFLRDVGDGANDGLYSSTVSNFGSYFGGWSGTLSTWNGNTGVVVYGTSELTIDDNAVGDYTVSGVSASGINVNVTVSGNDLNGTASSYVGLFLRDGTGTITGNTIHDHDGVDDNMGIYFYDATIGVTVEGNNTIADNYVGLFLTGTNGATIDGNAFTDNSYRSIVIQQDSDNNVVTDNTITMAGASVMNAIYIGSNSGANVIGGASPDDGNTITIPTNTTHAAHMPYVIHLATGGSNDATIQNNTIHNGSRAIQIDGGNTGTYTIADNAITNDGTNSIDMSYAIGMNAGNAVITGNTMTDTRRPLECFGAGTVQFTGNIVSGINFFGLNLGSYTGDPVVTGNAFLDFGGNGNVVWNQGTGDVNATSNWWGDTDPSDNVNNSGAGTIVYYPCWDDASMTNLYYPPVHNVTQDTYHMTIQGGIDGAISGDVIEVAAGTYREQLYVDHSLDLLGAGVGISIIEAPDPVDRTTYPVTQWTGDVRTIDAVIGIVAAGNVNISGFTVDGRDVGPDNFYGIHFFDTEGAVTNCTIDNITDAVHPNYSRVVSLTATHSIGQTLTVNFSNNSIPVFQKVGILIMGPGITFTVNNNTVVNEPSPIIAGNGIQLSYGATGSTFQNSVEGAEYTGEDWAATGILLFESGNISMVEDEVFNCQAGVDFSDWGWVYESVSPVDLSFTNMNLHENHSALSIQLSRANSDVNMTVTDCDILNSDGDGIDLYCTGVDPWGGSYYTGWENGDLNVDISGCYVSGNVLDGIWGGDYSGNVNNVAVSVSNCGFAGNVGSAINNDFTQFMDASGCYFDDPTGPTIGSKSGGTTSVGRMISPFGKTLPVDVELNSKELVAAEKGSGETIFGNIDYSPWLGSGTLTTPGFEGDFSTLYVDDDSPQAGTSGLIQEGIDLVTGSTVNVMAGTYHNDPTDVNKQVTLLGANADVDPAGSTDRGGETILTRDDTKSGFYVTASGVTINGFKLGTDTPQSSRRVNISDGATDVTIKYNIIMNTWEYSGHGVYISPTSDRAEVSYNTIDNPYWEGIRNNGASDVVISNNTVRNVDNFPIVVSGRSVISGNTVLICKDGIRVDYAGSGTGDRVEVSGNTVSYTEYAGINITGAHAYVHNNTVHHCNYWGSDDLGDWDYASIHVETSATNCIIDGNIVYDGVNGIQTWANDVTITNNEIYDMGVTYGDEKVVNLRTYKNSGILVGSNWGSGDIDPTGVVIHGNSIHDNYWGLFYSADLSNGVDAENNNWGASDGPEDTDGTDEASIGQCYSVTSMKNTVAEFFPTEGLGNAVSGNVDYCPWIPWSCCVVRGDINHSGGEGAIDISDLVYLVDYMFNQGSEPPCFDEADINGSGEIDISDLVYLVDYMFNQGPEPLPCL